MDFEKGSAYGNACYLLKKHYENVLPNKRYPLLFWLTFLRCWLQSYKLMVIRKSFNGHLEILASASRHRHRLFAKSLFLSFEVLYEESIYGEVPFKYTCWHSWDFRRCLEQLFCRKPVSACFWRKELHNRRYLRSFKNTQGLKLHFAGL